jgi:hypothetical protein
MDQLQTWYESSTWSATQLINFEGRSTLTFMVSVRVKKNGVLQGEILKLKEPFRVVPQMKALYKRFPDQLNFW